MTDDLEPLPEPATVRLILSVHRDDDDGCYVAGASEIDVWASGTSEREAVDRAVEAILRYLEAFSELTVA